MKIVIGDEDRKVTYQSFPNKYPEGLNPCRISPVQITKSEKQKPVHVSDQVKFRELDEFMFVKSLSFSSSFITLPPPSVRTPNVTDREQSLDARFQDECTSDTGK